MSSFWPDVKEPGKGIEPLPRPGRPRQVRAAGGIEPPSLSFSVVACRQAYRCLLRSVCGLAGGLIHAVRLCRRVFRMDTMRSTFTAAPHRLLPRDRYRARSVHSRSRLDVACLRSW